ncbi:PH domain-containing protein [Zhihengliuella halotolerans]|uniref:PH domain-containing protein n=1 Tax=Zhihengliuella halotolerans TaxID=370736 RepID=UPI000C8097FC|nr:PH domain-containing protein [Zhihengliuella halotolerans]
MSSPDDAQRSPVDSQPAPGQDWQRLSARMIWVDLIQSLLSLLPAVVAIWVVGVDPNGGQIWPLIGLAAVGVWGAVADALRWIFTSYRVTATHVEAKSGIFRRVHRSIQRDRLRSVDIEAKLRHRLSGLRVVNIGAGQQSADGDSAFALDSLSVDDARALQSGLMHATDTPVSHDDESAAGDDPSAAETQAVGPGQSVPSRVFARFEPRWVVHNLFSVWTYIVVLGIGGGTYWFLSSLGVDVSGFVAGLLDWESLGWVGIAAVAWVSLTAVGALFMAVVYFTEYWGFELARVRGREGTMLRTRHGLLTSREVNRQEHRIRGLQISEPLLWRWMGTSDTSVITTGLNMWSMAQPSAILPRGPVEVARDVAADVLGTAENPFETPLSQHPVAALRRRLWWATAIAAGTAAVLAWLAATGILPASAVWAAVAMWPLLLAGAAIAYRALGHTIAGPHLITRSGLASRSTTVLQRSAVSTIVVRESIFQRRLGLKTVSAMTAAGYCEYTTPDIDARTSLQFARDVAPGILDPFLVPAPSRVDGSRPHAGVSTHAL